MKFRFYLCGCQLDSLKRFKLISTIRTMTDRHQAPSYPLRMPLDLKAQVATSAKMSGRSLHAEIIARLQASFDVKNLAPLGIPRDFTHEGNTAGYIASKDYTEELFRHRKELQEMIEAATEPAIQKVMEQYLEKDRKNRERLLR